ncbi:MAG: glycosyltransferase family 9 protein [Planctomycetes bacterium]|nr:glycosyltransferase family 9 protein [Planctomycetota bacterium]
MQHPGILIQKTAALGDVLRTTSILPGLAARYPGVPITWATAPGAVDLVRTHPLLAEVVALDTRSPAAFAQASAHLVERGWQWVISLDDEEPLCALASRLATGRLSGAHLSPAGERVYTRDVAAWFDMGLLSVHGKAEADRLKVVNQKSHPQIYAEMLGIPMGQPELVLPGEVRERARAFAQGLALEPGVPLVGLNTGAGGRWVSKQLPVERTVELAAGISRALAGRVAFLVLGGEAEAQRMQAILDGLRTHSDRPRGIDAGSGNGLLDFAARVELCSLLVTSDSLALHMATALRRRVVAFFAPTSAAEIELYGLGEKLWSTATDYCSYRPDADNSSLTAERLLPVCLRQLERARGG